MFFECHQKDYNHCICVKAATCRRILTTFVLLSPNTVVIWLVSRCSRSLFAWYGLSASIQEGDLKKVSPFLLRRCVWVKVNKKTSIENHKSFSQETNKFQKYLFCYGWRIEIFGVPIDLIYIQILKYDTANSFL